MDENTLPITPRNEPQSVGGVNTPLQSTKHWSIPKPLLVITPIFMVGILLLLVLLFPAGFMSVLNRLGILNFLRSTGIAKIDVPQYFEALQTQNLLYDLNNDGVVSGDDYSHLVSASDIVNISTTTSTTTTDDVASGETPALPSIRAFSTDAFSGSATVSYPIDLPVGAGGLTPSLSISYSSSSVDDLLVGTDTKWRNDPSHSYQSQAGILGLGWSLGGVGSISRDPQGTFNDPSNDTYVISFAAGAASLTKESGDESYSVWRTVPNLKLKVERWGRCKNHSFDGGSWNICRYHWQVTDGTGSKYYFGSPTTVNNWKRPNDPDADYFAEGTGNDWYPLYDDTADGPIGTRKFMVFGSTRQGLHALTTTWLLSKVESVFDVNGSREVEINYSNIFEFGGYRSESYVAASYPKKITWGNHEVTFVTEPRLDTKIHSDDDDTPDQPMKAVNRLKKIVVKTLGKVRNAYVFDYTYGWDPTRHADDGDGIPENTDEVVSGQAIHSLLTLITPWSDDPSVNSAAKRLPAYSFIYGSECAPFKGGCPLTAFINSDNYTQTKTPNDFFLTTASNRLGGKTTFEYWNDGLGGNALDTRQCDPDKAGTDGERDYYCKVDHEENVGRHRVSAKVVADGVGGNTRHEYVYGGSGATTGLAYVKEYAENYTINDCPCETGEVTYCNNPLLSNDSRCAVPCDWEESSKTCCGGGETEYLCTGTNRLCDGSRGKTNRSCVCTCSDDHINTPLTGFEFLGYPEVETLVYEKNSSKVAARSKSFYHQAIETDSCFKPNPLQGVAYRVQNFNVDNSSVWTETESKYKVRFGAMFGTYTEKSDSDLASYCGSYNPETTVSLVMATDAISKSLMPIPTLCTKTSTDYNNSNGSIDHYALPHKITNYGKVSCADTYQDDTSDLTLFNITEYTSANTTKWLLPLPKETWQTNDGLSKYKHSRIYYDSQSLGTIGNYGQLTKTEAMVSGNVYSSSTVEYNSSYPWLVWRTTDPNGKRTTTEYDSIHHLYPVQVTNHIGQTIRTEYDFNTSDTTHPNKGDVLGLAVKVTDVNNATTTTVYDDFGRGIEVYLPGKSPGSGVKPNQFMGYLYFNEGDISPCNTSTNCLVGLGANNTPKMLVSKSTRYADTGGAGKVAYSHQYYDGLGELIQTRSGWAENEWSNLGIPTEEGLKDIITSQSYNSLGQVEYQTLAYTSNIYNTFTNTSYDTRNFTTDPGIQKVRNTYDGFGRLKQVFYPDGTAEETVYEVDGNPLKTKILGKNCKDSDPNTLCSEKISTTNAFGQVIENREVEQGGKVYTTRFENHPIVGLLSTTDTLNNIVSKMEYDLLGRKTKMWDIDMSPAMSGDVNSWRYAYDKMGNLLTQRDPKNNLTEIFYDDLYRVREKRVAGTKMMENTYDNCPNGRGKLCSTKSYNLVGGALLQNKTFEYDSRGRLTKETVTLSNMPDNALNGPPDQNGGNQLSTAFTYDEGGRVLTTSYPSSAYLGIPAETVTSLYNRNQNVGLTSSIGSLTYASNATYNKNSQVLGFTSGNNVTNSFTYRSDNLRLDSLRIDGSSIALADKLMLAYQYDPLGNIKLITDTNANKPAGSQFNLTQNFTYDALQRLKTVGGAYVASYTYDDLGNIVTKNEGVESVNLAYDPYSGSALSYYHRPKTATIDLQENNFTYDSVGNLITDHKGTYTYDADNRLISASIANLGGEVSADANDDGQIDQIDYAIWLSHFGQSTSLGKSEGDFNTNGFVDGVDYAIWRASYTGGAGVSPAPTQAFSPTPTSAPSASPTPTPRPTATPTARPTATPTPVQASQATCVATVSPSPINVNDGAILGVGANVSTSGSTVQRVIFRTTSTSVASVSPTTDYSVPYSATLTANNPGTTVLRATVYLVGSSRVACEGVSYVTVH